jgi:subtilisin family serine protease
MHPREGTTIRRHGWAPATALAAAVAILVAGSPPTAPVSPPSFLDVIVRESIPATDTAEMVVLSLGGSVNDELGVIGGFTASIPDDALTSVALHPAVVSVTEDLSLQSQSAGWQDATNLGEYAPRSHKGSLLHTGRAIGVDQYWAESYTGAGVGVAIIDTGVVPVEGLTLPGKVINGPDLSFESQHDSFRYLDTYGHGTHIAGIIAGRDSAAPREVRADHGESYFLGIAPDAHIVNVKVADHEGAVDVSQVIAAIDWIVQHKDDPGLNIRVLNLSYGTDSSQDPGLDPLSYAVEQAWKHGIFVVVASGNDGNASPVRNPATNPYVFAVGAADHARERGKDAQPVPEWSSCGTERTVDAIAPGASIVSLRNPGSYADVNYSSARVAERFFLGSGTSQAAAVASGAAALVLERNPSYGPDELKSVLMQGGDPYRKVSAVCQGAGVINLYDTYWDVPEGAQDHEAATGLGSLEGARGSDHLTAQNGATLTGEQDVMGSPWSPETWTFDAAAGTAWDGGDWNGATWSGATWSALSWTGLSWSAATWSGLSWTGADWSEASWSGATWSGLSWTGLSWSGLSWSGLSWSGLSWSGLSWTGATWSAATWT